MSRGSHSNIYFRLECRENRGSRQNFHRILFSKDRVLIKSNHYVTLQIYYHSNLAKIMKFNLSMDVKKKTRISIFHTQKYDSGRYFLLVLSLFYIYIFCNFHMKQEILVDNKIENKNKNNKKRMKNGSKTGKIREK